LAQNGGAPSPINTDKQFDGSHKMNNVTQIVQKVRQAPWRVQRQWIGLFLLALVLMAMIAGIYLNVSVHATLAGRETISMQATIVANQRINADMETKLAGLTSIEAMQKRAEALGFQPASPDDITYVAVPGFVAQSAVDFSKPDAIQPDVPVILPEYTESWFDYFMNQKASSASAGIQP
jgi:cell division protein FtsL